ncbi:MAG: hypothetical protein AB1742_09290 [bacterium]
MKRTTLILSEDSFAELKSLAAAQRRTISDLVNEFLQTGILQYKRRGRGKTAKPLPSFGMGKPRVDISDRDRLYDFMEGR